MTSLFTEEALYKKSSQELTALLYEALIDKIETAMDEMDKKQYFDANRSLQRANDILQRLGVGINYEAGIIADQLDHIYNYLADRIVEANIKKDKSILEEALKIITDISAAWNKAMKDNAKQQQVNRMSQAYEQHIWTEEKLVGKGVKR